MLHVMLSVLPAGKVYACGSWGKEKCPAALSVGPEMLLEGPRKSDLESERMLEVVKVVLLCAVALDESVWNRRRHCIGKGVRPKGSMDVVGHSHSRSRAGVGRAGLEWTREEGMVFGDRRGGPRDGRLKARRKFDIFPRRLKRASALPCGMK